ncbi:MAG: ribosomal protein S18-alanine N-acetyltransferase [Gammaproteobacteria bacterium]|nr:ribosomal protein S18-alanine N-acetyltransferase [Gammaproteobacteria bacterium]
MNPKTLALRLAVQADAEMIAGMSREFVEYGLTWTWRANKVARYIEQRDSVVLVAMDGRHLVAFAIMHYGDDAAHLNLLAVHPEYRLAGIGRQMMRWLEKSARGAGIFAVSLEVRKSNRGAQRFYQALGYHETTHLHGYYQGTEDAVRMHSDLTINADAGAE